MVTNDTCLRIFIFKQVDFFSVQPHSALAPHLLSLTTDEGRLRCDGLNRNQLAYK